MVVVYIRVKKMGSTEYLYLVKSTWDKEKGTSKQEIVKYLGAAADLGMHDIPQEYRGAPKVQEFLASRNGTDAMEFERERLYAALTGNDLDGALAIYEKVSAAPGTVDVFLDSVLRPVLYDIGQRWADDRIDIVTEHMASNTANSLVRIIRDRTGVRRGKISVVLCVPPGERHHIGCDVLETYLACRGFVVYNLADDTPTGELLEFVKKRRPDAVAVSASGKYSREPAKKLADRITDTYGTPVILGGFAFRNSNGGTRHEVCGSAPLRDIPKIIRRVVAESK